MRSKKPMKAAFVVTISAAAACGGKVTADDLDGGDTSAPTVNPPAFVCREGAPCTTSQRCGDPDLVCSGGRWSRITTNPPMPIDCLDTTREGDACILEGRTCSVIDRCADRPPGVGNRRLLTCAKGVYRWTPEYAIACPSAPPPHGTTCEACRGAYPSSCDYAYAPGGPCSGTYATSTCDGAKGTWRTTYGPTCNPPPPVPDGGI